jgi:CHAT domain-containing protein/Tfp pilus assembly protein PilF
MANESRNSNPNQLIYLLIFIICAGLPIRGQSPNELQLLQPNQAGERELAGGQTHRYKVELKEGEFIQVRVEQIGIDVVVRLLEKDSRKLAEIDSPNGTQGFEILSFIVSDAGSYTVEVGSLEANAAKGRYTIFLETPRAATEKDVKTLQAKNLVGEAQALFMRRTAESFRAAREKFLRANLIYREIDDKNNQAQTLFLAGFISDSLGEKQTALDYYNPALALFQATSDKRQEVITLNNLGRIYDDLGDKQKALEYLNRALPLFQSIGDKAGEATTLNNIGLIHARSGDNRKALEYYNQALPLLRAASNKNTEAATLNNIGKIFLDLAEKPKALKYFSEALELFRAVGNKSGEALVLNNMGGIYYGFGERKTALDFFNKAIPILRAVGNKHGEASALNNIGLIYAELYQKQKALAFFNQALSLFRALGDKEGEATTLNNFGKIYDQSREEEKALEFYNRSLTLSRELKSKAGEAALLNNIGGINYALKDYPKALEFYNQALSLFRDVGEKANEAEILGNIGLAYAYQNKPRVALDYFYKSLIISSTVGEKANEAVTLNNLMYEWGGLNNRKLAIFYGKLTVNKSQELRRLSKGLDNETQKTLLKRLQNSYMNLAELLIAEGQLEQAVQVLSLYQDQQFFDFDSETNSPINQADLSPREQILANRQATAMHKVGKISFRIEELKRKIGNRQPDEQDSAQLQKLESELTTADNDFSTFLKDIEEEFSGKRDEKDMVPPIKEVSDMKDALGKLSAATKQKIATIYNLSGKNKFYILIVTADKPVKHFETPIKSGELGKKIIQFHALLQSPALDPRPLGKELYDLIFKSVEPELKKQNIRTLMWQLDGNLRYIPMTALYDGKKYLLEKYRNVVFTRADKEKITKPANRNWTGVGFGSSQIRKVDLLGDGDEASFPALPGVVQELESIFRSDHNDSGILQGEIIIDKKFTKESLYETLKKHRPLVHISSHFAFRPGDDTQSFLVLGDGFLTLSELKTQADLFKGVELLTLSACKTAATQPDADGKEIDGFAELAQRLGADSVMATLWSVSDASTPWLMRDFYANRQSKAGTTKAEALQKAQLGLLHGTADVKPLADVSEGVPDSNIKIVITTGGDESNNTRGETVFVDPKDAPPFIRDDKKPFAHPFYWSPFILYGNWR